MNVYSRGVIAKMVANFQDAINWLNSQFSLLNGRISSVSCIAPFLITSKYFIIIALNNGISEHFHVTFCTERFLEETEKHYVS